MYERPLQRPFNEQTRAAITDEYHRRRHELPVATELLWDRSEPRFVLRSSWLSFVGSFTPEKFVMHAELSLAARMFATDEHRREATRIIDEIACTLNL